MIRSQGGLKRKSCGMHQATGRRPLDRVGRSNESHNEDLSLTQNNLHVSRLAPPVRSAAVGLAATGFLEAGGSGTVEFVSS